jgi:deoxyribodipyrimidine photo-lyase
MPDSPALVWFRSDLRLADNPAMSAAVATGRPVVCLFVLDDEAPGEWAPGGAQRWWLHHSLAALADALQAKGGRLVLRRGRAEEVVPQVAAETGAGAVHWNRLYEPWANARDARIKQALKDRGLAVQSHNARLLFEPWAPKTGSGQPYKVYTPFWKALQKLGPPPEPCPAPERIAPGPAIAGDALDDWVLLPGTARSREPDWADGLRATWTPGEDGARAQLAGFLDRWLPAYDELRNRPDKPATSRLSPFLHFGEIGPRQVWAAVQHRMDALDQGEASAWAYLSELGWRDFSYHLLHWWPSLPEETWKDNFKHFPWADDPDGLAAWQRGATGYPIVDAGMRELYAIGWMHNRVRMIVGSFLVKDLLIHWREGERWFWDTLVDADLGSNSASWQWVAGCGADAAPYFRIFNPVTQGQKFDPKGAYVRHWVPELAKLPDKYLHAPWTAPDRVLAEAGVRLGSSYPAPIVDHKQARQRALDAFQQIKQT